jgi:hypothetical protein
MIKVIITGVTGMVGEGVMHECLEHSEVEQVLVLGRRACGIKHPKLVELVHPNLYDLSSVACYFCLGTTSLGKNEEEYTKVTYALTMHVASTLSKLNSAMTFCYVSGSGTDSTEKGRLMWARVKGKTENDLMKLPFKQVFCFRPGFMRPTPGLKNALSFYKYINWLYPLLRSAFPGAVSTLKEVGLAMINVTLRGYKKNILEVKDIVEVAGN